MWDLLRTVNRHWKRLAVLGFVTVCVFYALLLAVAMWRGGIDDRRKADVVLVLGARAYGNGQPSPCLRARVRKGVELVQQGRADVLVVSGGTDKEDGHNEADVMADMARELGYDGPILKEREATSTATNLLFGRAIIEEAGHRSVIVVTHRFHAWRARMTARHQGWEVTTSPVEGGNCGGWADRSPWREPLALIVNKARGQY